MNILHMIPYTIFINNYIDGFAEQREDEKNFIYVYGSHKGQESREIHMVDSEYVFYVEDESTECFQQLYAQADILVLQSIPENLHMCSMICESYITREVPLIVVPWGRDLFRMTDMYRKENATKETAQIDNYKTFLIENCTFLITDKFAFDYAKKNYKTCCYNYFFNALLNFSAEDYKDKEIKRQKNTYGIMVGNRGTWTSRHIEVFEKLSQFDLQDKEIICPLVYGNPDYMQAVKEKGQELFENNIRFLTKWQERSEYYAFLDANVDAAIFNNMSSEGGTTIFFLTYMGKKILINPEHPQYHLLKDIGVVVDAYNEDIRISDITTELTIEEKRKNREIIGKFGSKDEFRKEWSYIYRESIRRKEAE